MTAAMQPWDISRSILVFTIFRVERNCVEFEIKLDEWLDSENRGRNRGEREKRSRVEDFFPLDALLTIRPGTNLCIHFEYLPFV